MTSLPSTVRGRLALLLVTALCLTLLPPATGSANAQLLPLSRLPSLPVDGPALVDDFLSDQLAGLLPTQPAIVFVHAQDGDHTQDAIDAIADAGMIHITTWDRIGVAVGQGLPAQIRSLRDAPGITYLEGNRPITQHLDTSHRATRADVAAQTFFGPDGEVLDGSDITIGIIDSGVDGIHPMFTDGIGGESKVVRNLEQICPLVATEPFPNPTFNTLCLQDEPTNLSDSNSAGGHGTHVAGIAAGYARTTMDDRDVRGAAPGANIVMISAGGGLLVLGAVNGMNWILENHENPCAGQLNPLYPTVCPPIKVTNHSYGAIGGGTFNPNAADTKLQRLMVEEGIVVSWAAGNDGGDGSMDMVNPPSKDPTPGVLSVANYDDADSGSRDNALAGSSSRGADGDVSTYPDISAPGSNITSACLPTLPICSTGLDTGDPLYNTISGTSMASPHVAGYVAVLQQAAMLHLDRYLTPAEVEDLIEDTAHKFTGGAEYEADVVPGEAVARNADDTTSFDKGHGLIDVQAALATLLEIEDPTAGGLPLLSIADASVDEGDTGVTALTVEVTLVEDELAVPRTEDVTVVVTTADGTATADEDYTAFSETVAFAPEDSTAEVTIEVRGDTVVELGETIQLTLTDAVGAQLDDAVALATIRNDDQTTVSIADAQMAEGDEGSTDLALTLSLTRSSTHPVTVEVATAGGTATAGEDYTAINNTLVTFPAGETTATTTLTILGDTVEEADETVLLRLSNSSGADLGAGATATILDDDAADPGTGPTDPGTQTGGGVSTPPPSGPPPAEEPEEAASEEPAAPADPEPAEDPTTEVEGDTETNRTIDRLSADERIGTAIAVSRDAFTDDAATAVVLSRADEFADALAGTPLAVSNDGPLLLTDTASLSTSTAEEIQRVLPAGQTVYLLGGTNAISTTTAQQLIILGYDVVRLSGADRVGTAIAVARELGDPDTILIATGDSFADALPAGAAAAHVGGAVLLTSNDIRRAEVDAYLAQTQPSRLFAIGGPAAGPYAEATPIAGDGRETTAVAVAERFFVDIPAAAVAVRSNFPDSLSGGAHIAGKGGPMLLTGGDVLHPAVVGYLCDQPTLSELFLYGGEAVLQPQVQVDLDALVEGCLG